MDSGTQAALVYVALSSMLCVVLWVPYIGARAFLVWGIADFLRNYTEGFPAKSPEQPLWAERAQRAHLNMVETLPAFIGVVFAATQLGGASAATTLATWAPIFFWARVVHVIVYVLGVPFLRTPVYLVSWAAILVIGASALG